MMNPADHLDRLGENQGDKHKTYGSSLYFRDFNGTKPGVYYQPPATIKKNKDGAEEVVPGVPLWICSPLYVSSRVRDDDSDNHGYLLEWEDSFGQPHSWIVPAEMIASDGAEIRRVLMRGGLRISTKKHAREHLLAYIQDENPSNAGLVVMRTGWHEAAFVLPDAVIGAPKAKIHLQSAYTRFDGYQIKGKWEDWRANVGRLCAGNHRLMFAVSAAFAAPLLTLMGMGGVGFHFRGASSTGKSTALVVAASVQGCPEPLPKWRTTDNALEGFAAMHNDALLCLDEMGQADAKVVAQAAYMLAQGQGKMRSQRDTQLRPMLTWRTLFLSNGEISLADMLASEGKRVKAGQEVRVVDLPADADKGLGVFDAIPPQFATPGLFADALKSGSVQFHGAVFREYLRQLAKARKKLLEKVAAMKTEWLQMYVPADAGGQVRRVADSFALVAAAGELASDMLLTGWGAGDAGMAAAVCFRAWIRNRGGVGQQEVREVLRQVKYFFEANGAAMFTPLEVRPKDDRTMYRKGFRDADGDFYVFPQGFEQDVCRGFDRGFVVELLKNRGWLIPDGEGKSTVSKKVPVGIRDELDPGGRCIERSIRVYHISYKVIEDDAL